MSYLWWTVYQLYKKMSISEEILSGKTSSVRAVSFKAENDSMP